MKKIFSISFIIMIISVLSIQLKAQQEVIFSLKLDLLDQSYTFYDSAVLKTLNFKVQNLTSEKKTEWLEITRKSKIVEKMDFLYEKDAEQRGQLVFYKPTSLLMLKQYIADLGMNCFYVYGKKVLLESLITIKEAQNKAAGFVIDNNPAPNGYNDSTKIEYYNFQIYYAESKLQNLWANDYLKNLFEGNVAKLTDQVNKIKSKRELFIKNK
jgi:hypothetical protein